MSRMRAILVRNGAGGIESLYLGEVQKPVPSAGEVLVKIKAFGLNRMDISQRQGKYPPPHGVTDILGVEFSGVVTEVGSGVTQWTPDDEVLGLAGGGAYAEFIKVPDTHVVRKPSHLSWTEAASIPENWLTAFQALVVIGQVKEKEDVMVHAAASGVGVSAIQLARFYGANHVIATASTKEKLDWLLSLPGGATHAVNYKTQDFAEEVKKITIGKGVDVVIDFVGQSHWEKNITSLATDGRMTMLSLLSGAEVSNFNLIPLLYKRLHIQGSTLRARSVPYQTDLINRFKTDVLDHITGSAGDGKLRTYIHKVYPWTDIQDAHKEMEENKNCGKIIAEVV
ncbi:quinone oxidoreductase [Rickenella mellea]|uniref:Quinone oxidoreductase n=1 Tax=Rickenella mellea TaxID=50990 RepID=A0A4Y7PWC6_9AGAM|nr:quinone oxidoreductase [Rickenella mellea]